MFCCRSKNSSRHRETSKEIDMSEVGASKPWYASRAVWGGIITVASGVAGAFFGIHATGGDVNQVIDNITTLGEAASMIIGAIGGLIAVYGRVKATMPVHISKK
jgi:hypothetical protein